MKIERSASAVWRGGLQDGKGTISTGSGALQSHPYAYASRFEGRAGTNPEELIAAAHAGCFSMALAMILGQAQLVAESIETVARVTLEKAGDGFEISAIHLTLSARVPGADEARLRELAEKAKANCPVSKALRARITLDATLAS